jgi:two-component system, NtrC family, response regulator HydG
MGAPNPVRGSRFLNAELDNLYSISMDRAEELRVAWEGVSAAFASLGRVLLCLDERFHVIHASASLDDLLGAGASRSAQGRDAGELLGKEVLGEEGTLRHALVAGEKREGWRAFVRAEGGEGHVVSVTAAPLLPSALGVCDPLVRYIVVLRPADEDPGSIGAPEAFAGLVARSPAMAAIFRLVENLRESDTSVLLTGESGTGKEVVARALHAHSPRRSGPFVAVNCGALPDALLESEMFGHVRGAFTGAVRDRVGRFELAAGGTLFLDEVADLPLPLQVKLLRVLQERSFERVGESRSRRSDARIIAATNVELAREVAAGRFREDLYYRLRVVPIEIPPLRDRREDVEPLTRALLARVASRQGRIVRLSPSTLRSILSYGWPGNVRELENALEYAVAVSHRETILPEDLPPNVVVVKASEVSSTERQEGSPERERLLEVLESHRWQREAAARALGISRTTLWRRMREAGIDP